MKRVATVAVSIAIVVTACATFDESSDTPTGDDGGVDGGDASTADAPNDSAGDASSVCVPEPIDTSDGGPEDPHCGPNGEEVALASSPDNCGFCGNVCGAKNVCTDGSCVGEIVTTGDQSFVVSPATTATDLYVSTNGNDCVTGRVIRVPLDGSPPQPAFSMSMGGCVAGIRVLGDQLYYSHGGQGIRVAPVGTTVDQGADPPLVADTSATELHVSSDALYWMLARNKITRTNLQGTGGVTVDSQDPSVWLYGLTGDETSAWWLSVPQDPDAGLSGRALWTRSSASGSTTKRVDNLYGTTVIAPDGDYIYLVTESGEVSRVTKKGTSAPEVVGSVNLGGKVVRSVVVAGDYVFFAASTLYANDYFNLYRVKKCGGRVRLVAHDYMRNNGLVAAGKYLYFDAGLDLMRIEITKR